MLLESGSGKPQPFHDFAVDQVRVDDFVDVMFVNVGVPDSFGIDHQHRSEFAAVQAAGLIDSDFAGSIQTQLLDTLLGIFLYCWRTAIGATGATVIALIQTEKYVMLKKGLIHRFELNNDDLSKCRYCNPISGAKLSPLHLINIKSCL